jgi:pimeloyl-ACP methyl ester carboxylesterase
MNYGDFSRTLRREFREIDGIKTAFFLTDIRENLPTILLVHGINGSHFGFEFLAEKLAPDSNLILVDLPGHGESGLPKNFANFGIADLQKWLNETDDFALKNFAKNSELFVVAHSFGCYAITEVISRKSILICPVPSTGKIAKEFAKIGSKIVRFASLIRLYNWVPFSTIRGFYMLHDRRKTNRKRIKFVAISDSKTTVKQRQFQAELGLKIPKNIFAKIKPRLVIIGEFDFIPKENPAEIEKIFPSSKIEILPTGHMPNVELVSKTAKIIAENFAKIC